MKLSTVKDIEKRNEIRIRQWMAASRPSVSRITAKPAGRGMTKTAMDHRKFRDWYANHRSEGIGQAI